MAFPFHLSPSSSSSLLYRLNRRKDVLTNDSRQQRSNTLSYSLVSTPFPQKQSTKLRAQILTSPNFVSSVCDDKRKNKSWKVSRLFLCALLIPICHIIIFLMLVSTDTPYMVLSSTCFELSLTRISAAHRMNMCVCVCVCVCVFFHEKQSENEKLLVK